MGGAPFCKVYCLTFQSRANPKTPFIYSTDYSIVHTMSHGQSRPNECKTYPSLKQMSIRRSIEMTNPLPCKQSPSFRTAHHDLDCLSQKNEFPQGNRARLYTEFNGSSPYHFGLDQYHPHPGQGDCKHSASKRLKAFIQSHSPPEKRDPEDQAGSMQYNVPCISVDSEEHHVKPTVLLSERIDDGQEVRSSPPHPHNEHFASMNSSDQLIHRLALPEDKSHLTALHCFVRRQCVYFFTATAEDVKGILL